MTSHGSNVSSERLGLDTPTSQSRLSLETDVSILSRFRHHTSHLQPWEGVVRHHTFQPFVELYILNSNSFPF